MFFFFILFCFFDFTHTNKHLKLYSFFAPPLALKLFFFFLLLSTRAIYSYVVAVRSGRRVFTCTRARTRAYARIRILRARATRDVVIAKFYVSRV